jgi:hypothetical protein
MVQEKAALAEKRRDLRGQVSDLGTERLSGVIFQLISPGRELVTIYSNEDGCPTPVPAYMLRAVMSKQLEDGRFMFVADPKDAPKYKRGDVKCFLHKDSPDRAILDEIGLAGKRCVAAHLASPHSKRMHGLHRHKEEWGAYQDRLSEDEKVRYEDRQDKQLKATLDIARGAVAVEPKGTCPDCGKTGVKRMTSHKRFCK